MTVWVFGDSFAHLVEGKRLDELQWMELIAKKLNTELKCYGLGGSSISYTSYNFNSVRDEIKENDIVIVCVTTLNRRWFFEDKPNHSGLDVSDNIDELNAIKKYRLYLDNNRKPEIEELINFLYNLHYLTEKKNLHTIVLNVHSDVVWIENQILHNIPLFHIAHGDLTNHLHMHECDFDWFAKWHQSMAKNKHSTDARLNHMIRTNHITMANKLINNITYNTKIDITHDFVGNVINFDKRNNKEWCDYELFGNSWELFGF